MKRSTKGQLLTPADIKSMEKREERRKEHEEERAVRRTLRVQVANEHRAKYACADCGLVPNNIASAYQSMCWKNFHRCAECAADYEPYLEFLLEKSKPYPSSSQRWYLKARLAEMRGEPMECYTCKGSGKIHTDRFYKKNPKRQVAKDGLLEPKTYKKKKSIVKFLKSDEVPKWVRDEIERLGKDERLKDQRRNNTGRLAK